MNALLPLATWVPILDGDPLAAAMYDRHYSSERSRDRRLARGTLYFVGPSQRIVLMTPCRRALWAWRKHRHRADDQVGVECSIFRNEGPGRASDLVRAADAIADQRWPLERHFTFVDPTKVNGQPAGNVFLRAGWRYVLDEKGEPKRTKERGLLILERPPIAWSAAA